MNQMSQTPRLRVDTHVHMHSCFEQDRFFAAAADNLDLRPGNGDRISGVLCLTETSEADWFGECRIRVSQESSSASWPGSDRHADRWTLRATDEPNTVVAADASGRTMAIVAGRQIVTGEGLEVLALGLAGPFADGQPTRAVLEQAATAGAIPVLPWGFGKWTGRRGRLVREIIAEPPCAFFLGDNGGRLSIMAEPPEFALGQTYGMRILPGTDPFPFSWDVGRVGSYGIEWDETLDARSPFRGLCLLLADASRTPRSYGRLERLPAFVRNQIAIQLRKRARKLSS